MSAALAFPQPDAFDRAVTAASLATGVPADLITGPAKGGPDRQRSRALAAYLASIKAGLSDTEIARRMSRDRSSIARMLWVIEGIREEPAIDSWIEAVSANTLAPPRPDPDTWRLFLTTQEPDAIAPIIRGRAHADRPIPASAAKILAPLAREHGTTPEAIVRTRQPAAIRHAAWLALYQSPRPTSARYWTQERIALLFGCTQAAVSRAIASAEISRGAA